MIIWPAATGAADEAYLRLPGARGMGALSHLLGSAALHRLPLPGARGLDWPPPELLLHDDALGRILVPPDRRVRLPACPADRCGHRRRAAERVGFLPRLPDDGPWADGGDRTGVPDRGPGPLSKQQTKHNGR